MTSPPIRAGGAWSLELLSESKTLLAEALALLNESAAITNELDAILPVDDVSVQARREMRLRHMKSGNKSDGSDQTIYLSSSSSSSSGSTLNNKTPRTPSETESSSSSSMPPSKKKTVTVIPVPIVVETSSVTPPPPLPRPTPSATSATSGSSRTSAAEQSKAPAPGAVKLPGVEEKSLLQQQRSALKTNEEGDAAALARKRKQEAAVMLDVPCDQYRLDTTNKNSYTMCVCGHDKSQHSYAALSSKPSPTSIPVVAAVPVVPAPQREVIVEPPPATEVSQTPPTSTSTIAKKRSYVLGEDDEEEGEGDELHVTVSEEQLQQQNAATANDNPSTVEKQPSSTTAEEAVQTEKEEEEDEGAEKVIAGVDATAFDESALDQSGVESSMKSISSATQGSFRSAAGLTAQEREEEGDNFVTMSTVMALAPAKKSRLSFAAFSPAKKPSNRLVKLTKDEIQYYEINPKTNQVGKLGGIISLKEKGFEMQVIQDPKRAPPSNYSIRFLPQEIVFHAPNLEVGKDWAKAVGINLGLIFGLPNRGDEIQTLYSILGVKEEEFAEEVERETPAESSPETRKTPITMQRSASTSSAAGSPQQKDRLRSAYVTRSKTVRSKPEQDAVDYAYQVLRDPVRREEYDSSLGVHRALFDGLIATVNEIKGGEALMAQQCVVFTDSRHAALFWQDKKRGPTLTRRHLWLNMRLVSDVSVTEAEEASQVTLHLQSGDGVVFGFDNAAAGEAFADAIRLWRGIPNKKEMQNRRASVSAEQGV